MIIESMDKDSFPIVRLSSKKHIEELRAGQLFFRHVMYYQRMEEKETARGDKYDGSIPFPDDGTLSSLAKETVTNARIMDLSAHVACFYHFHCAKKGCFYVPEEDNKALQEFNSDSALLIDTAEFEKRVRVACNALGLPLKCGDVTYVHSFQEDEIIHQIQGGNVPPCLAAPQFIKSSRFAHQNEYRISIEFTPKCIALHINGRNLVLSSSDAEELIQSTKIIDIGSIEDISEMVTTEELLQSYYTKETGS